MIDSEEGSSGMSRGRSIKEVCRFLGSPGWIRNFIKDYGNVTVNLTHGPWRHGGRVGVERVNGSGVCSVLGLRMSFVDEGSEVSKVQ